ncbi:HAD-IIIC family phosphatase [Desulfocurvus vexinensis]|uniref:HAD-IIIC family phosphatase n=1 Tax=Desulfocurvus vexinensis TaxID=399548 RepID=UPI0004B4E89D|nr:HAD-IIIC family phosphatase [Desulfocurvus vexinensis]
MLDGKTFSELQAELDAADWSGCEPLRLAVLRNVVLEPMAPALRHLLRQAGLRAELDFGQYDTVMQEALGPGGPVGPDTGCVLVAEALELLDPELVRGFAALEPGAVRARCDAVLDHARAVLAALRGRTQAPVLWCGYETPVHPALGVLDAQGPGGQLDAVRGLNAGLRALLAEFPNAFFVDLDLCLARVGAERFFDRRWWYRARAPYALAGLAAVAREVAALVRALRGRARKCLVLDCDGVLWGGVVGEDGPGGIHLGPGHPGAAYVDFQRAVQSLAARGVVLALCSKNNEADVWEVFRSHPGMVLGEQDIAAWRIDWNDKAGNIEALARELNLGLDAMVFVDDSAFEAGLVRARLPEVAVLHLPAEGATGNADTLAGCGLFDTLSRSAEDRARGVMYRGEARRRRLRAEVPDLDAYLRSLDMRLDVRVAAGPGDAGPADAGALARVAQLTQKTNQFNLTARRRSADDVRALAASPGHLVAWVALEDRFGAMGIVGAAIAVLDGRGGAQLDTFLLSCRALGRGVETAFLAGVLAALRARGAAQATGLFVPTARNAQVRDFYPAHGFAPEGAAGQDGALRFVLDLDGPLPAVPGHFSAVDGPAGAPGASAGAGEGA